MSTFGQDLRAQRESRHISLDAMSAETRVSLRHFEALEGNDFAALPGGVFRRGIVRAYLAALHIETEEWMQRFDQSLSAAGVGDASSPDAWATFAANVKRNRSPSAADSRWRWLALLFLIALVTLAAWAVWKFLLHQPLPR